jgi:hypothetical protein
MDDGVWRLPNLLPPITVLHHLIFDGWTNNTAPATWTDVMSVTVRDMAYSPSLSFLLLAGSPTLYIIKPYCPLLLVSQSPTPHCPYQFVGGNQIRYDDLDAG